MTLRAGLLNMMPDKALAVSERHFADLLGVGEGRDVRLLLHTIGSIERGPEAAAHVARHYRDSAALRSTELDVLVITGANVSDPCLPRQVFWADLCRVLDWATAAGVPTLCSCLATHAVLAHEHGQERRLLSQKCWGVFDHRGPENGHALLRGVPDVVPVPHSRHNGVTATQLSAAGYDVLLQSAAAGVHLAVQRAGGRRLLMQGHPEYEAVSLLKEYKREVRRWQEGERAEYPPAPTGYFRPEASALAAAYETESRRARRVECRAPAFPETDLAAGVVATWREPARRIVANWLASVLPADAI